jgi:predicted nucleotidyltransferase
MRNTTLEVLFPRIRHGILSATLTQPDKWWYLSELAARLRTTPSSLQRELAALVRNGILEQRREGARAYFKAQTQSPIYRELRGIFEKTSGIVPTLRSVLDPLETNIRCAFIYGSIARGSEHGSSDIDLMIIGSVGLAGLTPALRKAERVLNRAVNATVYSADEFRHKARQHDHFLETVLKGRKEFVKGSQRELDAITGG